jgi:hypothetical protein
MLQCTVPRAGRVMLLVSRCDYDLPYPLWRVIQVYFLGSGLPVPGSPSATSSGVGNRVRPVTATGFQTSAYARRHCRGVGTRRRPRSDHDAHAPMCSVARRHRDRNGPLPIARSAVEADGSMIAEELVAGGATVRPGLRSSLRCSHGQAVGPRQSYRSGSPGPTC